MRMVLRMWSLVKPYRGRLSVAYACLLVGMALDLTIPWLLRQVIDVGVGGGRADFMVTAGLIILGIGLGKAAVSFGQRYFSDWLAFRVSYDLKNKLYKHIENLPFAFHDSAQTGQLMTRCTGDVNAVQQFASVGLLEVVSITVMSVATITILVIQDARLALIALAPLPFLFALAIRFGRLARSKFGEIMQARGKLNSILQENLQGVQVVKGFAREPYEIVKFHKQSQDVFERRINVIRYFSINFPAMSVIVFLSEALILWFGGREVLAGSMTIGTLAAFNGYVAMLGMPARRLGFFVNMLSEALASAERVFDLLDEPVTIHSPENASVLGRLQGRVTFENVSFRYPHSDTYVLRDVDLEAEPGQVIALLGKTGSGKTTVVNLIPRFYDVPRDRGRVSVDGVDVREVALDSLRGQIGIVLQESLLFSATIRENIAYGRQDASDGEVIAAAKAARAHDFIVEFVDGYNTPVGERGVTLSGGQRQRIAIARALLMDPRILILDDSTSSVDTETEYLIQQALRTLMEGRTTFVIAQRLQTLVEADQILVLDHGHVLQRGRHAALLAEGGLYREIYDLQLRDQERLRRELMGMGGLIEEQPRGARKSSAEGAALMSGLSG
ncbi:MAG: ABC transporter ATP-binding protein [Chloroflexi bacterium]|nr:ABC transporter ATP-binding protein [Chloroflexota bacterium]MBL7200584.1 ABC transporter ATP-binding protein [Anaerolineae bacterium]